jgi:hypothetical protein
MAGSYRHAVTDDGKLRSPDTMSIATETPGDAYATIEEMYGMIWFLAAGSPAAVERAQRGYKHGIRWSPGIEDE